MRISDLLKMGLRNLLRRKARTALTVVGVIIGTISITVMISIGCGVNAVYKQQVMENGSMTKITLRNFANYKDENGEWQYKEQKIDETVLDKVKAIEHVGAISPVIRTGIELQNGRYNSWAQVTAMDSSTFESFGFPPLEIGSYPTAENNRVIVFGTDTLGNFYSQGRYSKNKTVDLTKDKVTLKFNNYQQNDKKKPFSLTIRDYAKIGDTVDWMYRYNIYIDLEYYKEIYTKYASTLKAEDRKKAMASLDTYEEIQINVDNMENVEYVQGEIEKIGLRVESDMEYLNSMIETSNMLQMVLFAIGAVAMLVSAINIANTMIMSIYERTKEIGIMKVLGCFIKDIKKLFLFEAALIGLIGGAFGVGLSYAASYAINKYGSGFLGKIVPGLYSDASQSANFSLIPWWLPIIAVGLSMIVGIASGYMPARRATKISAIEAMKTES